MIDVPKLIQTKISPALTPLIQGRDTAQAEAARVAKQETDYRGEAGRLDTDLRALRRDQAAAITAGTSTADLDSKIATMTARLQGLQDWLSRFQPGYANTEQQRAYERAHRELETRTGVAVNSELLPAVQGELDKLLQPALNLIRQFQGAVAELGKQHGLAINHNSPVLRCTEDLRFKVERTPAGGR